MRYQVPVTVTLRANSTDDARRAVQRLVDEAPTAHHVYGVDGWRFAIGEAAEAQVLRTDRVLSLSDDELAHVQQTLADYRDE